MNVIPTALARTALPVEPTHPETTAFAADVIAGLTATPKRLPPKYFYDVAGSELFERITELPEYYPTRTEIAHSARPCRRHRRAHSAGRGADRVRQRRQHQDAHPARRREGSRGLRAGRHFGRLPGAPGRGAAPRASRHRDASGGGRLHEAVRAAGRRATACRASASFPARRSATSSRTRRRAFLRQAGETLGAGAMFIVGVDLVKDQRVLKDAYNDKQGVTARFNLNLLTRMNRELGAQFRPGGVRASRVLQSREVPHRDAPRQPEAAEACGCAARPSISAPARPSTPRTATSTRWTRSPRWRAAPAGSRSEVWTDPDEVLLGHALRRAR